MSQYVRQFTTMSTDWATASFVAASFDWFFGHVATDNAILNFFGGMLQLTLVTLVIFESSYALGLRDGTNTIQNTWITFFAVWTMSPKAVKKLTSSYYSLHKILYGSDSTDQQ
jgi:hypothetical protein